MDEKDIEDKVNAVKAVVRSVKPAPRRESDAIKLFSQKDNAFVRLTVLAMDKAPDIARSLAQAAFAIYLLWQVLK